MLTDSGKQPHENTRWPKQSAPRTLLVAIIVTILALATPFPLMTAGPGLSPSRTSEMRGVWAHYYGTPDWEETMRCLHESNFNVVFPYMCSAGVAYYPSRLLPRAQKAASTDYLAAATRAGLRYGVQVHARMLVLEALFATDETKSWLAQQGRLMHTSGGKTLPWLCPTNPYNREQIIGVALEIVRNYRVHGLQFDYIRYPHRDCCFCEYCQRKFVQDTGATIRQWPKDVVSGAYQGDFIRWRQQQITSLMAEIIQAVKSTRPDLAISAAVFPDWTSARERFGQDVATWIEQELVDFICPMDYTADTITLTSWLQEQQERIDGRVPLVAGLGPFSDACQFSGPQQLVDQILIARAVGAAGFVVFNYNEQLANDYLPYLGLTVTSASASIWPPSSLQRF